MASGRPGGGGGHEYKKNRALMLAEDDLCWLCGHYGAQTADHVITDKQWPRDAAGRRLPGFDARSNLRPAHGTKQPGVLNRCPDCGQLCNQARKDRAVETRRSRHW